VAPLIAASGPHRGTNSKTSLPTVDAQMKTRREFLVLAARRIDRCGEEGRGPDDPNQQALRKAAGCRKRCAGSSADAPVRRGRVRLELPPLIDNGNSVRSRLRSRARCALRPRQGDHGLHREKSAADVLSAHLGRARGARACRHRHLADTQTVLRSRSSPTARSGPTAPRWWSALGPVSRKA